MRDYFRAAPTFWRRGTGKKFRGDPPAQILAWYLMVPPGGGLSGVFPITIKMMADDTGLTETQVRASLGRFDDEGFAYFDESDEYVWVVGTAKHQIPEGISSTRDNRWGSIVRELRHAGSHEYVKCFLMMYGDHLSISMDDVREDRTKQTDRPSSRMKAERNLRPVDPPVCEPGTLPKGEQAAKGAIGEGEGRGIESVSPSEPPTLALVMPERVPGERPQPAVKAKPTPTRGTRITRDWSPTPETIAWCADQGVDAAAVVPEFIDHWIEVPGAKGVKVGWDGTFRNRVRKLLDWGTAPTLEQSQTRLKALSVARPSNSAPLFTDDELAAAAAETPSVDQSNFYDDLDAGIDGLLAQGDSCKK